MKSTRQVLTEVLTELKSIDMTDERNFACYCDGIEDAEEIVENKIKEIEMMNDEKNPYLKMKAEELAKKLYEYSIERSGDLSDLTYAASVKINVLAAREKEDRQ
jgi:hypothetical protein